MFRDHEPIGKEERENDSHVTAITEGDDYGARRDGRVDEKCVEGRCRARAGENIYTVCRSMVSWLCTRIVLDESESLRER